MHQSTISALESGAKSFHPWPGWKTRLSLVLGIPADELFEEVDDESAS